MADRRWWVTALGAVVTAAGCGSGATAGAPASAPTVGGPPTAAALEAVQTAAGRTLGLTASVTFSLRPAGSGEPYAGSALVDFGAGSGTGSIIEPGGMEHLVFLPGAVYDQPALKLDSPVILPQGKNWIAAEPGESGGLRFSMLALEFEDNNPAFLLHLVAWGATLAVPLGQQAVGSKPASAYEVTVDPHAAASKAYGPTAAAFAATLGYQNPGAAVPAGAAALSNREVVQQPMTIEVWTDGSGRLLQMQATLPGSEFGTGTMTLGRFGVHVETPARPPVSQTVDLASFGADNDGPGV